MVRRDKFLSSHSTYGALTAQDAFDVRAPPFPIVQHVLASVSGDDSVSASRALQAFWQVGRALGVAIMGRSGTAAAHHTYSPAVVAGGGYPVSAFALLAALVRLAPRQTAPVRRAGSPASV